jgi:hypothetical protein
MHIVELHKIVEDRRNEEEIFLQSQNNNNDNDNNKYRFRTAAILENEKRKQIEKQIERERKIKEKDAIELLNAGVSYGEVSNLLRIPTSEVARIEMENQTRMMFLLTGKLPESGSYISYMSGIPTPR